MRGRAEVAGGESDSVLSFRYFFLQEIFSELACAGCWEQRGEQNIFFLSLSLWKYLSKLKNRNRVMGIIWEVHRAIGHDPVWGGIMEDFLEGVTLSKDLKDEMGGVKRRDVGCSKSPGVGQEM